MVLGFMYVGGGSGLSRIAPEFKQIQTNTFNINLQCQLLKNVKCIKKKIRSIKSVIRKC